MLTCYQTYLISARGLSELLQGPEFLHLSSRPKKHAHLISGQISFLVVTTILHSYLLPGQRLMLISSQARGHSELLLGPEPLHSYKLPGETRSSHIRPEVILSCD
jgi:hypothetical protein